MEKGCTCGNVLKRLSWDFARVQGMLFPYPVLLKETVIIYHNGDLITTIKLPYLIIVYFLDVTEPVAGEIILHTFEKMDLLGKERIFVLFGLAGEIEALVIRDNCIILPVLVKSGELPPVDEPVLVGFAVEHVWINTTDGKTAVINPAPSVFQKPAGSRFIIPCPYRIPRDIEYAILVAKFGCRRRFERRWIKFFYCGYVAIEQEYMAVECPGATLRARRAPEPNLLNHASETFHGIFKKAVAFLH